MLVYRLYNYAIGPYTLYIAINMYMYICSYIDIYCTEL